MKTIQQFNKRILDEIQRVIVEKCDEILRQEYARIRNDGWDAGRAELEAENKKLKAGLEEIAENPNACLDDPDWHSPNLDPFIVGRVTAFRIVATKAQEILKEVE